MIAQQLLFVFFFKIVQGILCQGNITSIPYFVYQKIQLFIYFFGVWMRSISSNECMNSIS
uniref:Uncharacterized protein n=1 Tax=Arundo donax TaxID=35708 RepID=A0A0A9FW52_ARUDO